MSTSPAARFVIVFTFSRLYVEVADEATFDAAVAALEPFMMHRNNNADEYAAVAQAVTGQEYSRDGAEAAGLLDEDGNPGERVSIYRAD